MQKGILITVLVSMLYLGYLCALDFYFVVYANEVRGWYNSAALLIFSLPIVLAIIGYQQLPRPQNLYFAFLAIPVGLAIAFFQLLWVATEFHALIGGSV